MPPRVIIEQSEPPADAEAVRRIAAAVFTEYGDYRCILPKFYASPGVTTFLARRREEVVGFVLVGLLPWTAGVGEGDRWLADLLAIAISPLHQRSGIGSQLLARAEQMADEMRQWRDVTQIQLTCAADNDAALAFFARNGYRVLDAHHGQYNGGQEAWRLAKDLRPDPERLH